jgi:hypothetical protein
LRLGAHGWLAKRTKATARPDTLYNIAETLWRKLKHEWLQPGDYTDEQTLFYQTRQALAAVGNLLQINFSQFALVLK